MIKKRIWTKETATDYVLSVETGRAPRGLKYCSALSYLGIAPDTLSEMQSEAKEENKEENIRKE